METNVNYDYKQWYIFHTVIKRIQHLKFKTAVCLGEYNKYLEKYFNDNYINIQFVNDIRKSFICDVILIAKDISKEQFTILINSFNNIVLDCYSEFKAYEERKKPIRYIVNDFKYSDNGSNYKNYSLEKDKLAKNYIDAYIESCIKNNKLFNKVEIETINRCNGVCTFCPVNRNVEQRKFTLMDKNVFKKVIYELKILHFTGTIALFGNNEPLLDKRIVDLALYVKSNLPEAFLYIYTNGTLLTLPLLLRLLDILDYIFIDNYNSTPDLIPQLMSIYNFLCKNKKYENKVSIHLRNSNEILSSRGGQAPNKYDICSVSSKCILPYSQLNIKSNGNVSICCNDAKGEYIVGNVAFQSIKDIWYGEKFTQYRKQLSEGRLYPPCDKCDFIFTPTPFEKI